MREKRQQKKGGSRLGAVGGAVITYAYRMGFKKTLLLSAALAASCLYAGHTYVIGAAAAANVDAQTKLANLRVVNKANEEIRRTNDQFMAEFAKAVTNYETARRLLPEGVEVSNVLAAVQELAAKNRVKVTRFNDSAAGAKSAAADKLYERVVLAQVTGNHADVARFFADVAQYPRIIHIRDFSITSLRKSEVVDFTLVAFYAPSPSELPALPAGVNQQLQ